MIFHRVNFDLNIFTNFYKINVGIDQSLKNNEARILGDFLKSNNLDFRFDEKITSIAQNVYIESKYRNLYQRLIEYTYPIKINKNSKIILTEKSTIFKCKQLFSYRNYIINDCR